MNGIKYLLDSNIILGIIKGNPDAGIKLKGINLKTCAYSSVTRMELLGFPDITANEIKIISSLLSQMAQLRTQDLIKPETTEPSGTAV